jgi:photosystem II stability/assembly factor-like uncharacterized protein
MRVANIIIYILIAILLIACKEAPNDAPTITTQITGKITDKQTAQPITGAKITTVPVTSSIVTGSDGNYTIPDLVEGQYTITAQKEGYNDNTATVTVKEGNTVNADIQLDKLSPQLEVSNLTLDFETTKTNINIFITNKTKIGIVTWILTSNQQWLTASPTEGTTTTETDPISVTVDRNNLDYGNYSGQITIISDAGTIIINVIMTKANPSQPQITINPKSLDFGSTTVTLPLEVKNTGTGTLVWTASTNFNWITASSLSGSLPSGNLANLNISVNKSGLTPNSYTGSILFNSNGGSQTLSISMTVPQGILQAPYLQISGSVNSSTIPLGWTKITDSQFHSYKIFRASSPGVTENSTLVITISDHNTNFYTDSGLLSNTTYFYRVFVYGNSGIGSGSNEISVTTLKTLGTWVSTTTISSIANYVTPNSLYVLSESDVWLAAKNEVWHYNGNVWAKALTISYYDFNAIYFLNQNLGWAVGDQGRVYQYNGVNWTEVFSGAFTSNYFTPNLYDIVAFSQNDIWISSNSNKIFHYINGQWVTMTLDATFIKDLDYVDSNTIFAADKYGKIFKYNGVGWAVLHEIPSNTYTDIEQISVVSANDIWVATDADGRNGNDYSGLWHSDGSSFIANYKLASGDYYGPHYAVQFITPNEGWASKRVSYTDVLSYFNGSEWKSVPSPISNSIKCIKFTSGSKGWAVGSGGEILRYSE